MKWKLATSSSIIFCFTLLSGQSPEGQHGAGAIGPLSGIAPIEHAPQGTTCPVEMRAKHLADGSTVKTDGAHPQGIGQRLSLSLIRWRGDESPMVAATLEVHGIKPNGHVTQTISSAKGTDDLVETLTVPVSTDREETAQGSSAASQAARANLWIPGMSAVDRIDLKTLWYGDGSIWKVADGWGCQVIPDRMMPITSH
jgi:hypothetical protein